MASDPLMRRLSLALLAALGVSTACWFLPAAGGEPKRTLWTASRVVGSPEPPLPYRAVRLYPKLKLPFPIAAAWEPGTNRVFVLNQDAPWAAPGYLVAFPDKPEVETAEKLLTFDGLAYGFAFHPKYVENGHLFVGLNGPVGKKPMFTRVVRYTVDRATGKPDPRSAVTVIEWDSDGHNGGDVAFAPDGTLFVTSGDGTADSDGDNAGQDLARLRAKVLRIDVDRPDPGKMYSVPRDNPFVGRPNTRPETWAYGFRNPWRITIDPPTGDVWVGNNGQDLWEQVYLVEKGANYGWSVVEGGQPFDPSRKAGPHPIRKPIADHHHAEMRSLTGGVVYRGRALPELHGAYVYGDWSTGRVFALRHDKGRVTHHRELADTTLQVTGFALDAKGELVVVDHGGGFYRLEPVPAGPPKRPFPTRLSDTGLFLSVAGHTVHPGLVPYSVNAPLWSDGAEKERFVALSGDAKIEYAPERGWNFPDGAVLVKSFALDTPAGKRYVETRLMTRQAGEWAGYTYRWNAEQTDAELVGPGGADVPYPVRDGAGGERRQVWHYPSRAECMVCHSRAANWVLGLCTVQMNKDHDFGRGPENQIAAFDRLGLFKDKLPKKPAALPKLADPYDPANGLDARARSYLHANCSSCHVWAGGGNAAINLEWGVTDADTKLFGEKPRHDTFGLPDARLVAPGDPGRSVLVHRVAKRGPGQMPQLATSVVDEPAVRLLREWVRGMKAGK